MVLEKLSHEKEVNAELLDYENLSALLFKLKRFPGITFPGFVFHHNDLCTSKGHKVAVVFFHGEIDDELLDLLHLKKYVYPDEIAETIYTDYLEITTSELCILKNRIHTNIFQISQDLQAK